MTAIGARHLARKGARVLAHIGARGTAFSNVCLLDRVLDLEEIRVTSARAESRAAFGERLERGARQAGAGRCRRRGRPSVAPTSSSRPRACPRPSRFS